MADETTKQQEPASSTSTAGTDRQAGGRELKRTTTVGETTYLAGTTVGTGEGQMPPDVAEQVRNPKCWTDPEPDEHHLPGVIRDPAGETPFTRTAAVEAEDDDTRFEASGGDDNPTLAPAPVVTGPLMGQATPVVGPDDASVPGRRTPAPTGAPARTTRRAPGGR